VVALTVDEPMPEKAAEFVRRELAAKLPTEDQPWQTEAHHLLPRWQIASVRKVARLSERGGPVE